MNNGDELGGPWAIRRKSKDGTWYMANRRTWHDLPFARRFMTRNEAVRYLARYLGNWPDQWDEVAIVKLKKKATSCA